MCCLSLYVFSLLAIVCWSLMVVCWLFVVVCRLVSLFAVCWLQLLVCCWYLADVYMCVACCIVAVAC